MPLTEQELIRRLRAAAGTGVRHSRIGIGDDCAVFPTPPGNEILITTDLTLEGVHFRREWHPPDSVGHRCLARGLSDIASMGGTPMLAFLSVAVPEKSQSWLRRFTCGLLALATRCKVELAGGDTAESRHGICADITIVGVCPRKRALLRSGAHPGDAVYVTGELGGSAYALSLLQNNRKLRPRSHPAHFYPAPRVEAGRFLRERNLATAAIDTSDGLSTDLSHICEESGVRARLFAEAIPIARTTRGAMDPLALALHGGEDYELLFTASAAARVPAGIAGIAIHRIGEILARSRGGKTSAITIVENGRERVVTPKGWEHFR